MGSAHDPPGTLEVLQARRFFAALQQGDAIGLLALLDEQARLINIDGPVPFLDRPSLAAHLAGRDRDVTYLLEEVTAAPGLARARFTLHVAGVPGAVLLEARLTFLADLIRLIVVRPVEDGA